MNKDEKIIFCDESNSFVDKEKKEITEERITWKRPLEFVLNVVGYTIGLGNVWRFSYYCYKNGGGAFLIPYLLFAAMSGLPLLFQEVAMGQFTKQGSVGVWRLVPIMRGIGYASALMAFYFLIYFVYIMGWCILYLVNSFTTGPLPWSVCGQNWNTNSCFPTLALDETSLSLSTNQSTLNETFSTVNMTSSSKEFWNNYVLRKTDGIHNLGTYSNWQMVLCHIAAWTLCYLCIAKGIRSTGKIVYVTVTAPYVMMTILLIRGVTLEGAGEGIRYYLIPDLSRLLDPQVWLDAGSQILYSLGICYSALCGFGSYNKFNADCYKQSFLFIAICCGSSLFVGFVIFSFMGHMAHVQHKNISDVATAGPGLIFEVIPAGVSLLPVPQVWSAIFFIMLIFIAIDTVFGSVEGLITSLADLYPSQFGTKGNHLYKGGLCFIMMVLGLPLAFDGGIYIFELLNFYASSGISLLWVAFFESVAIGWIYGADKFMENVKSMIGYYPSKYFKYCFKYFTPSVTVFIFLFFCAKYSPLKLGDYRYPVWADVIGWMLSLTAILCIPITIVKTLLDGKGTLRERWEQGKICKIRNHLHSSEKSNASEKERLEC